MIITYCVHSKK